MVQVSLLTLKEVEVEDGRIAAVVEAGHHMARRSRLVAAFAGNHLVRRSWEEASAGNHWAAHSSEDLHMVAGDWVASKA